MLGVALKLTRLSLCSNYRTKDNPGGPLSEPVQEANSFVSDQINTALEQSRYAIGVSAWGWKGQEKKKKKNSQAPVWLSQTISVMVKTYSRGRHLKFTTGE